MMNVEMQIQELEEIKRYFNYEYESNRFSDSEINICYANRIFNYANTIQMIINLIREHQKIIKSRDQEIRDLSSQIIELRSKNLDHLVKAEIDNLIDSIIRNLEEIKQGEF